MTLPPLNPETAHERMAQGAVLVDIRPADEHAREHIAQALNLPLEHLGKNHPALHGATAVIFYCRSGNRTRLSAQALNACAQAETYVLEGGLDAWKKAGLPVVADASQPLELQRQVQIAAGTMIVLTTVLGATVTPWFYLLSGLIGAGLVFAGISGFCGLARVLMKMPWNQRPAVR